MTVFTMMAMNTQCSSLLNILFGYCRWDFLWAATSIFVGKVSFPVVVIAFLNLFSSTGCSIVMSVCQHITHLFSFNFFYLIYHFDGLEQERRNSIANILELCLSCTNRSILCNKQHLCCNAILPWSVYWFICLVMSLCALIFCDILLN